jgi:predicted DNA-binding WGR domain protein
MDQLTNLANEPFIQLAAIDSTRNIRRGYTISRTSDLFGWQVVSWAWGRLDRNGMCRTRAFPDEAAAHAFVRQLLARRKSAPTRIGVAYQPVNKMLTNMA